MKSVKFWRTEIKQLSLTERIFFRDAIQTLFSWEVLKEEYSELDLIMRILNSEIRIIQINPSEDKANIESDRILARKKIYNNYIH